MLPSVIDRQSIVHYTLPVAPLLCFASFAIVLLLLLPAINSVVLSLILIALTHTHVMMTRKGPFVMKTRISKYGIVLVK